MYHSKIVLLFLTYCTKVHTCTAVHELLQYLTVIMHRGAEVIRQQIEMREQARLLEAEKKDQETQSMLRYLERLQQEDMDNLIKKREAQHKLMEEVAKCNEV